MRIETIGPDKILLQELALFADQLEVNIGLGELRACAKRINDRLHDSLITQQEVANLLNVNYQTVGEYRKRGWLYAIPKNPKAKTKRWLYRRADVLQWAASRPGLDPKIRRETP